MIPGIGNPELSGITAVGGDTYLSVADSGATLHHLEIAIDATTGEVSSATSPFPPVVLADGVDLEGVAYRASTDSVFASDEVGPAIREHDPDTGAVLGGLPVPAIYSQAAANASLESLALAPDESAFWSANEVALLTDRAAPPIFTAIRLQRFSAAGSPDLQVLYHADSVLPNVSGVVELLVLPGGELLVLERTFSLSNGSFDSRLFLADVAGATDTSSLLELTAGSYIPASKQLLWSRDTGPENFEGMVLGPTLANGDRSLLLLSEQGGNAAPTLLALRIAPEPDAGALLGLGAGVLSALALCRARPRGTGRA